MSDIKYSQRLIDMLQPGKKVKLFYNEGNPNNELRHIRAIVDDEYIVYRVWSRHKQYWIYHVNWIYDFHLAFEGGNLKSAQQANGADATSD